jgi:hypothetical protein
VVFHFVFPSMPLEAGRVDEHFAAQQAAFAAAGFTTSLVSDATFDSGARLRGIPDGTTVVLRGWMVDELQYTRFAKAGATLLTSPAAYLRTHHLPNWYEALRDFTPETRIYPADADLEAEMRALGWPAFFVKDYVKSLKTSFGSIVSDPSDARHLVDEMRRYRGTIEGGLCVRRVEVLTSEVRYFVLGGRAYANDAGATIPAVVQEAVARVDSPFFSVDVAVRDDGVLRIVEIGDGQVSDLVGWETARLVAMFESVSALSA